MPSRAKRARGDETAVLEAVAVALEGEGPDAGGLGPLLRATAHLAECLGERLGVRIVPLVGERLELGRRLYGPLDAVGDARDWEAEALAELADAVVYLAARGLQLRHGGGAP